MLGTPVPPPPADAGSIPADDKLFGGLSLREKLEPHKRNATCANCHTRIDPLGFPLEHYDSHRAAGGSSIPTESRLRIRRALADQTEIAGVDGLLKYLRWAEEQVLRTPVAQAARIRAGAHDAGVRSAADRAHGGERAATPRFRNWRRRSPPASSSAIGAKPIQ